MLCRHVQLICVTENSSRKATIEILPLDVLVKIFDSYRLDSLAHSRLEGCPWKWQKLAHVCKTWRSILSASSHNLDLQLFFTYGMPVREILSFWPVLPIVMQYTDVPGSSPLTLGDQDNIMALLELPTRLRGVHLTVTTPLLEKITTFMQQTLGMLEYLHLSTIDGLVLPNELGGGMPRLRALHMVGFALPALPQLLLSAHDLVTLRLDELPTIGYTLEALIISLPAMMQLETLRVHFLSPTFRPVLMNTDRILPGFSVLPVLNSIEFHGTSEYLESLLFGISAPRLEKFSINFFNQLIFNTPQLRRFISHSKTQQSLTHAIIHSSFDGISIVLTELGLPHHISLRISGNQLDWQIPSMAEVCDSLSSTLADVDQLEISTSASLPDGQDDRDLIYSGTLELLCPFRNVKRLCVTDRSLPLVSGALGLATGELALPELQEIQTQNDSELTSAQSTSLARFIAARRRSTHPAVVRTSGLNQISCRSVLGRRARFNDNPVTDVHSFPSPGSSVSSDSSLPQAPDPLTPSPIPPAHALPYIPPAPLKPCTYLHTVIGAPALQYDMRYHPNQSNFHLPAAVLAEPATSPPLASLLIRIPGLPWHCAVQPNPSLSPGNAVVTVEDVLVCLYFHLRKAVKADEYHAMGKAKKAEIYQTFDRRVGHDPAQRGKGLRRVDFLGGHIIAQGLVRAQSKDEVWDLAVR